LCRGRDTLVAEIAIDFNLNAMKAARHQPLEVKLRRQCARYRSPCRGVLLIAWNKTGLTRPPTRGWGFCIIGVSDFANMVIEKNFQWTGPRLAALEEKPLADLGIKSPGVDGIKRLGGFSCFFYRLVAQLHIVKANATLGKKAGRGRRGHRKDPLERQRK